jgi:hypothetical protein
MVGSIPAGATAFSTDQSDLWWNPAESGWGVQFVQTGSNVFATMYVYGPSGEPIWYIATLEPQAAADTWSGDLYMGTGPWFGTAPFNPASVAGRKVGTMTWTAPSTESGALTYVVDGVPVSKTIYRQTLRYDDFAGSFSGSFYFTRGCGPLVFQGSSTPILVTHGTNQLVVKASVGAPSSPSSIDNYCTFTGDYVQFGHFGRSQGTFDCEDGSHGTHNFTEMTVQTVGWTKLWSALLAATDDSGCAISGHLFGTSGPTPTASAPTCSITPSQTVNAGTSVTLALANCSPGTGLTYSWNQGSPAGPQVSTAATYTTPPLTATTTYFATVSANGRSTTYLSTVSVNAPPLPGSCSAYTGVNMGDLHFDGARVATSGVSGSDVVVGRIVVPSGWAGKVASIAIYEYDDPAYAKKAYLSKNPCDFTTVWPAYNEGNSMNLKVSFETSMSNAVRMNAGEIWYLTVKNERLSGAPSCASGSSCNFAITMSVPSL